MIALHLLGPVTLALIETQKILLLFVECELIFRTSP